MEIDETIDETIDVLEEKTESSQDTAAMEAEIQTIKKQLEETKVWGHKINATKKMIVDTLKQAKQNNVLPESIEHLLDVEPETSHFVVDPLADYRQRTEKERTLAIEYDSDENAQHYLHSFEQMFLFSPDLQKAIQDEMSNLKTSKELINYAKSKGKIVYTNILKPIQEKGGLEAYVAYTKELEKKVNGTTNNALNKNKNMLESEEIDTVDMDIPSGFRASAVSKPEKTRNPKEFAM